MSDRKVAGPKRGNFGGPMGGSVGGGEKPKNFKMTMAKWLG